MSEIIDILREIIRRQIPVQVAGGKVLSVNTDDFTAKISPADGGPDLEDVRLRSLVGGDTGVIIVPAVNSYVLFAAIENNEDNAIVLAVEKISHVQILAEGGAKVQVKDNGEIILNDGNLGGLVKIKDLQDNLDSIKNHLQTLQTAIQGAFTAVGAGPSASGPNGATAFQTAMSGATILYKNMENTKIKQ